MGQYPHVETLRLSDAGRDILEGLQHEMGCSRAEVLRRLLWKTSRGEHLSNGLSSVALKILDDLQAEMRCSQEEVLDRVLWMVKFLFSKEATLSNLMKPMMELENLLTMETPVPAVQAPPQLARRLHTL